MPKKMALKLHHSKKTHIMKKEINLNPIEKMFLRQYFVKYSAKLPIICDFTGSELTCKDSDNKNIPLNETEKGYILSKMVHYSSEKLEINSENDIKGHIFI